MDGLRGIGRISRVSFSKTGRSLYCHGRVLARLSGSALKANYFDEDTLEEFWVSNPRRDGADALFPGVVEIDEDAREDYWTQIRQDVSKVRNTSYRSPGKTKAERESIEKAVRRRDMDRRFRAP